MDDFNLGFPKKETTHTAQLGLFTHPSTTKDMEVAVSMCGLWGTGASRVPPPQGGHILLCLDDLWLSYSQLPSIRNFLLCKTLTKMTFICNTEHGGDSAWPTSS